MEAAQAASDKTVASEVARAAAADKLHEDAAAAAHDAAHASAVETTAAVAALVEADEAKEQAAEETQVLEGKKINDEREATEAAETARLEEEAKLEAQRLKKERMLFQSRERQEEMAAVAKVYAAKAEAAKAEAATAETVETEETAVPLGVPVEVPVEGGWQWHGPDVTVDSTTSAIEANKTASGVRAGVGDDLSEVTDDVSEAYSVDDFPVADSDYNALDKEAIDRARAHRHLLQKTAGANGRKACCAAGPADGSCVIS